MCSKYQFNNNLKLSIMPQFDRTGPQGQGSQTGRGMGKCRDDNDVKNENSDQRGFFGRALGLGRRGQGQGQSQGRGRGFGFRNR